MNNSNNADELLAKYLQTVSRQLSSLPTLQRDEELREVRAHLEEIATHEIENSADELAAMQSAIAQFGAAKKVGRELALEFRRGESWWRFGAAIVAGMIAYSICQFSALLIVLRLVPMHFWQTNVMLCCSVVSSLLAGLATGAVAKKMAPRRASLVFLFYSLLFTFPMTLNALSTNQAQNGLQNSTVLRVVFFLLMPILGIVIYVLLSAGAALVGWRQRKLARVSLQVLA